MRIVLDAFWWVRGTQSLKNVVHGLIETWSREYVDDELVIVVRRKHLGAIGRTPPNVEVRSTRLWPHALAAMFAVPWYAWRTRADAMLAQNFAPLFGNKRAVLLHDVMFVTNPEWFKRKEILYYRWMVRAVPRADIVFATTRSEGERILANTRARRLAPVGLGLSEGLIHGPEVPLQGLTSGAFVLLVGRLNVRKNVANTLEGVRLSGSIGPANPLVIVGVRDGAEEELPDWVAGGIEDGAVRFTGFVDLPVLRWLIRNCALYICLSLDEGFGLPPVEARALGARVLVSDRPVFRETLGNLASYVDPLDTAEVGAQIRTLLSCQGPADAELGAALVERYSWIQTVNKIRGELMSNA